MSKTFFTDNETFYFERNPRFTKEEDIPSDKIVMVEEELEVLI